MYHKFVFIYFFYLYCIDPLHSHSEPSWEDTTGQMVHAVWWRWETEVDWGSACCGNCQGCQTHQLCGGMGSVSLLYMYVWLYFLFFFWLVQWHAPISLFIWTRSFSRYYQGPQYNKWNYTVVKNLCRGYFCLSA